MLKWGKQRPRDRLQEQGGGRRGGRERKRAAPVTRLRRWSRRQVTNRQHTRKRWDTSVARVAAAAPGAAGPSLAGEGPGAEATRTAGTSSGPGDPLGRSLLPARIALHSAEVRALSMAWGGQGSRVVTVGASPCWVALQSCGSEPQVTIARATSSGINQCWEGWIIWATAALCRVQCWEGPRVQGCHRSTGTPAWVHEKCGSGGSRSWPPQPKGCQGSQVGPADNVLRLPPAPPQLQDQGCSVAI